MVNVTHLLTVGDITSTSIALSWNHAINASLNVGAVEYDLSCETRSNWTTALEEVSNHKVSYILRSTTSQVLNGLIPNTYYNCCIATSGGTNTINECTVGQTTSTSTAAGMTLAGAGTLGAFLGILIVVTVALVVVAIVIGSLLALKKQK